MASPRWSRILKAGAAAGAAAALLAGCGGAAEPPVTIVRTSACAVSAPSGFTDAGVGTALLEQVRLAARQGLVDTISTQRVSTPAQAQAALERFAADGCTLTALVGAGGASALDQVAGDTPDRAFLAVGTGADREHPDNVLTVDFDLRDSAFLAGFAAAHATRTGTVAVSASTGQAAGDELLRAFDEGVEAGAEQADADVRVVGAGMIESRTIEDTGAAGADWAQSALDNGADVLMPFGSASPQGVVEHLADLAQPEDEDDEGDTSGDEDAGSDPGTDDAAARAGTDSEALAAENSGAVDSAAADSAAGTAEPEPDEDPAGTSAEEPDLPYLLWYGSDGSTTLPGPVRDRVIASIVPRVDLGLRAVLTGWPGEGGDPSALATGDGGADTDSDADSDDDQPEAMPEVVGGLEVASRRAVGDLDNGGVEMVVSDGVLSSLTGLGRALSEGRALLDEDESED